MSQNYESLYNSGAKTLIATYAYDSYPAAANALTFSQVTDVVTTPDNRVKGVKTYEKIAVLGSSNYIERAFYYDHKARLSQTVEKNNTGNLSRYSAKYDFVGNVIASHESHSTGSQTNTVLTNNTYDHRNRLLSTSTSLNAGTPAVVNYAYNELGQQMRKTFGTGAVAVTSTYAYNIQGWLTSQSSPKFSMSLNYFPNSYTGNITQWNWGHSSIISSAYDLTYDKFNRLLSGIHSSGSFNESGISYDLNGNILSLNRTGNTGATFAYNYDGNKLTAINGAPYTYDSNGNMISDGRKNLQFTYNILNLPTVVKQNGTTMASYLYAADGTKLKVSDASGNNGYEYFGGLTLAKTNGSLSAEYNFGEGVIRGSEISYFITDHLGSVRSIVNQNGQTLEVNDYYPFGTRHNGGQMSSTNRQKFNGKELQTTGNIGYLDYGARMYDSEIGRWFVQDPMTEKYYSLSPYDFVGGNPISRVDYNGMDWYFGYNGEFLGKDELESDMIRVMQAQFWDMSKNENGMIDSQTGIAGSVIFSNAKMDDNAALKVYDHFNVTGQKLVASENPENDGNFSVLGNFDGSKIHDITVRVNIERNRNSGLYDNANNVISSFEHEHKHVLDAKFSPKEYFYDEKWRERRAIEHQRNLPVYTKTTQQYKESIDQYYGTFK